MPYLPRACDIIRACLADPNSDDTPTSITQVTAIRHVSNSPLTYHVDGTRFGQVMQFAQRWTVTVDPVTKALVVDWRIS